MNTFKFSKNIYYSEIKPFLEKYGGKAVVTNPKVKPQNDNQEIPSILNDSDFDLVEFDSDQIKSQTTNNKLKKSKGTVYLEHK